MLWQPLRSRAFLLNKLFKKPYYRERCITIEKGEIVMKLNCNKCIIYVSIFVCLILLSVTLINRDDNRREFKSTNIIMKSVQNNYISYTKEQKDNEGIREVTPKIEKSGFQTLPVPDINKQIIVTPLY